MFYVGQKVVCVKDHNTIKGAWAYRMNGVYAPKEGEVFTIREINTLEGMEGLYFQEITNPIHESMDVEYGYYSGYFRPLTDISVFQKMLTNIPIRNSLPTNVEETV